MGNIYIDGIKNTEYQGRIDKIRQLMKAFNISHIVVYSDEHYYENLLYLCGYRPIFEMAALIIGLENKPILLTGYEGKTKALREAINCEIYIYGPFTVQGMLYSDSNSLSKIFSDSGLSLGNKVGLVGPRYYLDNEFTNSANQHSVPSILVHAIRSIVGEEELIINVTPWLTNISNGLRSIKSASEISALEEAGTRASRGVAAMLKAVKPDLSELELLGIGQSYSPSPLFSYPPLVNSGQDSCNVGLVTSTEKKLKMGEPVIVYYSPSYLGYSGNCGRSGIISDGSDISPQLQREMNRLFNGTYKSYRYLIEHIRLGVSAKVLIDNAKKILVTEGLTNIYSPIHSTGLTEWENSFDTDEDPIIQSGHVLQLDYTIYSPDFPLCPAKIEDAVAIADNTLQAEFKEKNPSQWERIMGRKELLLLSGIEVDSTVLPLSDLIGQFFPLLLSAKYHSLYNS